MNYSTTLQRLILCSILLVAPLCIAKSTAPRNWATITSESKNAVVLVRSFNAEHNIFEPYNAPSQSANTGSAFFVKHGSDHYLLTNFHVVQDAIGMYIEVPSCGKELFEVQLVCARPHADLALLKMLPADELRLGGQLGGTIPYLKWANSDAVKKTEEVITMGFPLTDEGLKTTTGIISGKERIDNEHYLQMTAPISYGNSGGPTLNAQGCVIGMNSRVHTQGQNTGYMIPSNTMQRFIASALTKKGSLIQRRPTWGIVAHPASEELYRYLQCKTDHGVYIMDIIPGSLSEVNGIKKGDVLHRINDQKIDRHGYTSVDWSEDDVHFVDILMRHELGQKVKFYIDRHGKKLTFDIKVQELKVYEIDSIFPRYERLNYEMIGGLVVMELTNTHIETTVAQYVNMIRAGHFGAPNLDLIKYLDPLNRLEKRIFISNILPNSQAQKAYIKAGMILDEVNGAKVRTLDEFRTALKKSKKSGLITVSTEAKTLYALDLKKVLCEENGLCAMYCNGKQSSLVDALGQHDSY